MCTPNSEKRRQQEYVYSRQKQFARPPVLIDILSASSLGSNSPIGSDLLVICKKVFQRFQRSFKYRGFRKEDDSEMVGFEPVEPCALYD